MIKKLLYNQEIPQNIKVLMPKKGYNPPQSPNIEENNQSKESQSFLLKEFLDIKENSLSKEITKEMLQIFNPSKTETEDIFEEEEERNQLFFLSNEKQAHANEIFATDDKSSEILLNQNNNIVISSKLFHIQEPNQTNQNLNTQKIQFISKKRKNPEKNVEEFEKTKKDITSIIKIRNQKTQETNENTQNNKEEKNVITILKNEKHAKFQYRLDYYKKAFKVNCFKYLTKFLNDLIAHCNLPNEFKNKKIFKPNNESFTANAKEEDNFKFLFMTIKEIYCFVKDDKKNDGISLQLRNKEFIYDIIKYIENKGINISEDLKKLKKYLNMTMEDYIKVYYDTNEFKKFCKEEKIKYYEEEFIKEKKFPMLKDHGFLKLIKIYSSNKNFSNGLKSIHQIMNGINSV